MNFYSGSNEKWTKRDGNFFRHIVIENNYLQTNIVRGKYSLLLKHSITMFVIISLHAHITKFRRNLFTLHSSYSYSNILQRSTILQRVENVALSVWLVSYVSIFFLLLLLRLLIVFLNMCLYFFLF